MSKATYLAVIPPPLPPFWTIPALPALLPVIWDKISIPIPINLIFQLAGVKPKVEIF